MQKRELFISHFISHILQMPVAIRWFESKLSTCETSLIWNLSYHCDESGVFFSMWYIESYSSSQNLRKRWWQVSLYSKRLTGFVLEDACSWGEREHSSCLLIQILFTFLELHFSPLNPSHTRAYIWAFSETHGGWVHFFSDKCLSKVDIL